MATSRRVGFRASALAILLLALACSGGDGRSGFTPTEPDPDPPPNLSIARVDGDGQVGVTGRPLVDPLVVRVTEDGMPRSDVAVRFVVEAGGGEPGTAEARTDAGGLARTTYTSGPGEGTNRIAAEVDGGARAVFRTTAVGPPAIASLNPDPAQPGDTLRIGGENFSPIAAHDRVTIGGQAATVVEATTTRVDAIVPSLTGEATDVVVSLTGVASDPVPLGLVVREPDGDSDAVGAVEATPAPSGSASITLPFGSGTESYLLAVQSLSEEQGGFQLALGADAPLFDRTSTTARPRDWSREAEIRALGYTRLERWGAATPPSRRLAPAAERSFTMWHPIEQRVVQRTGELLHEGTRVLVYVDDEVPGDLFDAADAHRVGEVFDDEIYDPIRDVFGHESDVDGNGKVIMLLSPLVNMEGGDGGVVFGYFDPFDLSGGPDSNHGEIFYTLVPDPSGQYGPVLGDRERTMEQIVATAAHEFVHMVAANERGLTRGLPPQRLWLEEGLAHFGEFVVDRPDWATVIDYLAWPTSEVGLTAEHDGARGPATLFVMRLADRFGLDVAGRLVTGPGVGSRTAEAATGRGFADLVDDWALAIYNELFPVAGLAPTFGGVDLGAAFERETGVPVSEALGVRHGSGDSPDLGFEVEKGAVAYVVLRGSGVAGPVEVTASAPASAELRILRVRIE